MKTNRSFHSCLGAPPQIVGESASSYSETRVEGAAMENEVEAKIRLRYRSVTGREIGAFFLYTFMETWDENGEAKTFEIIDSIGDLT